MALTERVTNDYDKWTQSGDQPWTLSDDNDKAKIESPYDDTQYINYIEKTFELTGAAGVKTATLSVTGRQFLPQTHESEGTGRATVVINLKDADDVWHQLFWRSGWATANSTALVTFLDEFDIKSYLPKAGTYTLQLKAAVRAAVGPPGTYYPSYIQYEDVHLLVEKFVDWEKEFDESAPATELFVSGMTFLEPAPTTEYFTIGRTIPLASVDEKLLVATTDKKVYEFLDGAPEGTFDIHDEDFGMPGVDKTLDKVQFSSPAEAPHTVEVLISTDSGLAWTSYGLYTVSKGIAGRVSIWITAEKFCVRFKGAGLHLDAYSLYGVPRGAEVPE